MRLYMLVKQRSFSIAMYLCSVKSYQEIIYDNLFLFFLTRCIAYT